MTTATIPTPARTPARAGLDLDRLSAAKFRAAHDLPYLAAALFSLQPVACPDLPGRTMAVDDRLRLFVHPEFLAACSVAELAGVLCHEALHVLLQHGSRAAAAGVCTDEQAERWNLAADAAINEMLAATTTRTGEPVALPDLVLPVHLGFGDTAGLTTEAMYLALSDPARRAGGADPDDEDDTDPDNRADLDDQADGDLDADADTELDEDAELDDNGSGDNGSGDDGPGEGCDGGPVPHDCGSASHGIGREWEDAATAAGVDGMAPGEVDLVRHKVAAAIADHRRNQGMAAGHGGLDRWAQELLEPTVDWRTQLRTQIRRGIGLTMGQVQPSYARPSRRTPTTGGVILPGMRAPVPAVAVIVDTSGSMGDDELDDAVAELAGILRSSSVRDRQVRVWACDTTAVEVSVRRGLADTAFPGDGGTALTEGFAKATSQPRWRPDVIVVLTDGGTDWPAAEPDASVIVGLIGPDAIDSAPSWARTIRIEPKGLFR